MLRHVLCSEVKWSVLLYRIVSCIAISVLCNIQYDL
jgi:hypothetical protein